MLKTITIVEVFRTQGDSFSRKLITLPFCYFFSIFSSRIKPETESTQSYQTSVPFASLQVYLLKSLKVAAYPPSLIGGATRMAVS
jgi:hypothetical protein